MRILNVESLKIPEIKIITFARFNDNRGYFTEHYRNSDFYSHPEMEFIKNFQFVQFNESFSKKSTVRGMHFQWNPYMGKLVRTLMGKMIDMILDIRKNSPTFGKMIAYDMPTSFDEDFNKWIWIPPGFAHGNYFIEDSMIEYLCSGEYSQNCEAGISPLANDIDWSLCKLELKKQFNNLIKNNYLITEKDKNGLSVKDWANDPRSDNFIYAKL
ncbi:MAG: dTDP-4-dehydrorhamnose 3,5-epimerase family protein [Spirochaetes bacterium]|nr:dTDP-4-dehydrorhamnose 3,5-epimerase family protein [Spirochaetota bacterium]